MTTSQQQIEATAQLDRARAALGHALGQTQDITSTGLDVEQISQSLAGAVRCIFTVQNEGLGAPQSLEYVQESMEHLRQTLKLLQDVQAQDPSLAAVTGTIARILALIYPVSKMIENMSILPEAATAGGSPIPLVSASRPAPKPLAAEIPEENEAEEVEEEPNTYIAPLPSEASEVRKMESIRPDGPERRYSDRRVIKVDIGIQSDTNFFTGFTQDISSGGLFIATYDVLDMGTALNVNFSLPHGPVLSLDGTVSWIREYNETTPDIFPGMGVRFKNLTGEDEQEINHFIAKNPPIFYDVD